MPNPTFQAIIGATNESSAAFKALRTDLATARKEADAARKSLANLSRPGAMTQMHGAVSHLGGLFGGLNTKIGETHGMLSSLFPALAGLGALGSVPGLFELVNKVAEARVEMIATADKLGLATSALARFDFVAKMTHTPVEAMQMSMSKLNKQIGDMVLGKKSAAPAAAILMRLGYTMKELKSGTVTAADVLPKLADAFQKTHDPALKAAIATILFARGGQAMIHMLNEGGKGIREYTAEAEKLQYAFTPEDDRNLENYHQSMVKLETAVGALGNSIASSLAPALTPIIEEMTQWVTVNREWITQGVKDAVLEFANLPWKTMGEDVKAVWTEMGHLTDFVGGSKNAIEGLLALSFGAWALRATVALGPLGTALLAIAATYALIKSMQGEFDNAKLPAGSPLRLNEKGEPAAPAPTTAPLSWNPSTWLARVGLGGTPAVPPIPTIPTAPPPAAVPSPPPIGPLGGSPDLPRIPPIGPLFGPQMPTVDGPRPPASPPPASGGFFNWFSRLGAQAPADLGGGAALPVTPTTPLPSPYAKPLDGAPGPDGKPAPDGKLQITITVPNMPPGGSVTTSTTGTVPAPTVDVGHATPMGGF